MFARTKVSEIVGEPAAMQLRTDSGHTVSTAHVVVCAGYESLQFLPRDVADVNNTFALVTEPLANRGSG